MCSLWFSFLLGFFLFPVLYALVPSIFNIQKKRQSIPAMINPSIPVSENLKLEIKKSINTTDNLGWINVVIQRIFFDAIRNYYLEHRIKETIMKSFATSIGEGLLKNVKIKSLNFGAEAPFLKHIKLITPEEFTTIIKNYKESAHDRDNDTDGTTVANTEVDKSENMGSDINGIEITHTNIADNINTEEMFVENTHIIQESQSPLPKMDEINYTEVFKNATFFGSFEYNGVVQIMVEVELPKGIIMSLTVTIRKVMSNFLFRVPAVNFNTRYEISFINNPVIDIEVDSGLITELKKLYFQGSISSFIKRSTLNSFKNVVFYPIWLQLVQPNISSNRLAPFYPVEITSKNLQCVNEALDQILVMISTDFRLCDVKNEIIHKKSHNKLNEKNYIYSWCFMITKTHITGTDFSYFEGLSSNESKVLFYIQSAEGLKDVFTSLKDINVVFEHRNITILKFIFSQYEMEYIKVIYKNNVVLYKNNTRLSEFIVFKVQDSDLCIFNYSDKSSDMFFNDKRVEKLKKIIINENFFEKPANKFELVESTEDSDTKNLNFDIMFQEALKVDDLNFNKFECSFKMRKPMLRNIINDPEIRIKLFEEHGKFVGSINETHNVKTLIAEYKQSKTNEIKELQIHTFKNKKFIVDICPERNQIFIFKIKNEELQQQIKNNGNITPFKRPNNIGNNGLLVLGEVTKQEVRENRTLSDISNCSSKPTQLFTAPKNCLLEVLYKSETPIFFPNFFIESIKIKESFQKYYQVAKTMDYVRSSNELKIEKYVSAGTIYLELKCELEDDYSFEVFSCKKQLVIFRIYKIITTKVFKFIFPVDNDYIKILAIPKHKRNTFVDYKFREFKYNNDILIHGMIGLGKNEKFKIKINGSPTHVIFWEKTSYKPIRTYIQDVYGKNEVNECGMLRSDNKEYLFVHKNQTDKQRNIKIYAGLTEIK